MRQVLFLLALAVSTVVAATAEARAPDTFEEDYAPPINVESPQWFNFELRIGPYQPQGGRSFEQIFGNDKGWLLGLELDIKLYQIPYVGSVNLGLGWGWAKYSASTLDVSGASTGEDTEFIIFPMSPLAVLRVDALARYTVVPITFAAKMGADFVRWKSKTAGEVDSSGLNKGFRWGVQGALELDFLAPNGARRLDEEWGVNHSYLFAEYYGSNSKGTGDKSFAFGLGIQF